MAKRFLLNYFATWLPHQQSNPSDDLLIEWFRLDCISHYLNWVRLFPVDIELAKNRVLEKIAQLQPDKMICCGMPESYQSLTVEPQANKIYIDGEKNVLPTQVDLV